MIHTNDAQEAAPRRDFTPPSSPAARAETRRGDERSMTPRGDRTAEKVAGRVG